MPQSLRNSHPAFRLLAGLIALALIVEMLHSLVGFGSPRFSYLIEEWIYNFLTATAAAVTLARAIRVRDDRAAWMLLGVGLGLWAAGDVYWTAVLRDQAIPPLPSPDDALYLTGYAFIIAGLVVYVRSRVARLTPLVWVDVATGAFCVAAIGTTLLRVMGMSAEASRPRVQSARSDPLQPASVAPRPSPPSSNPPEAAGYWVISPQPLQVTMIKPRGPSCRWMSNPASHRLCSARKLDSPRRSERSNPKSPIRLKLIRSPVQPQD